MNPNGLGAQLAALVLCVVVALDTALVWHRVRRWWGTLVRSVAVLLCASTALAAAGIWVNREMNLFTQWSEVGGRPPAAPAPGALKVDRVSATGSRIVTFTIAGTRSGIRLPAKAYLPPGYDSPQGRRTRYPVIEALTGFPGTPNSWLAGLDAQNVLDRELAAGRIAPTVVVFPFQTYQASRDSECVDAVGGAQFDTYLSVDVRAAVTSQFRVRADRTGWVVAGTSTGGFCATNLALRHPGLYAAAASLSGYFTAITDGTTGDLYRGDEHLRDENSPLWRVQHLPLPDLGLFLCAAADDQPGYRHMQELTKVLKPPVHLTRMVVPVGGHTLTVWRTALPVVLDWLSGWLGAPSTTPPDPIGSGPVRQGLSAI